MGSVREEIAKNLLFYRKKSGLTQKQLAEKLGVKNSSVSNWENGVNSIDIETLYNACGIFGVTLNEMYGMYSSNQGEPAYTPHQKKVIEAYINNPNMQEAVDRLLGVKRECEIAEDMAFTIQNGNKIFQKTPTKQK